MLTKKDAKKGLNIRFTKLTMKQQKAVNEYIKTGNKSAAIRAAYNMKPEHVAIQANKLFKKPKILNALEKALKDHHLDDDYAIEKLKKIVEGGMQNIDITRPETSLKALETYWKLTNKLNGGDKQPLKTDPETTAKKMDMSQLTAALKDLDKKQKRILAIIGGKPEEGEILE